MSKDVAYVLGAFLGTVCLSVLGTALLGGSECELPQAEVVQLVPVRIDADGVQQPLPDAYVTHEFYLVAYGDEQEFLRVRDSDNNVVYLEVYAPFPAD